MEMEDQYNMSDLRQLMNGGGGRIHFPSIPLPPATELFPNHRGPPPLTAPPPHHQHHHYEQLMMMGRPQAHEMIPRGLHHPEFRSPDSTAGGGTSCNNTSVTAAPCLSGGGLEAEAGGCLGGEGSGRWPRQETLTLLEIRSRLDFKFKEANQKGPVWDEVSRIMCEEHGYQRSGKKCREKFENLYKYYKKTKEGKAGRQDGKHYRFFRQLEALYGETANPVVSPSVPEAHFIGNNNTNLRYQTASNAQANQEITTPCHLSTDQKHCESLSLSNSSEFDTSSSEDQDNDISVAAMDDDNSPEIKTIMRKRRGGRGWKAKIKEFIDAQMRKLMEKQEEWMERLMRTLEQKERERMVREEEWRKQEVERVEREHKFWAKERAWIEARDKALMEALHKLTGGSSSTDQAKTNYNSSSPDHDHHHHQTSTDHDQIVHNTSSAKELLNKKRKENVNSRSSACYYHNNESCSSLYNSSQGGYCAEMNDHEQGGNDHGSNSPCGNANVGNGVHENCFPFLMSEGENLWENYGLKLSKGSQNQ